MIKHAVYFIFQSRTQELILKSYINKIKVHFNKMFHLIPLLTEINPAGHCSGDLIDYVNPLSASVENN